MKCRFSNDLWENIWKTAVLPIVLLVFFFIVIWEFKIKKLFKANDN